MIKKIKVLQVIGSLRIGGAENVAMNFCRYLDKNKYQCDFLVFGDKIDGYEEEAIALGSNVIHIPFPNESYKNYFNNLKRILKDGEYEIVHTHILLNNGLVLKAAHDVNLKKRVSHSHSTNSGRKENFKYKLYESIMKKLIKKYSTHVIACGSDAGNYLFGEKLFKRNGIVINNGINTNKFRYNIDLRKKIRQNLGLENKLVVGHIGRLATVKNHEFLIDVFYEVNKIRPNSTLLIVGDGEQRNVVERKIRTLGIEESVIITGIRSDVSDILQAMDVFVFPSFFEGLPLTIIEAQSSGIQCLVSSKVTSQIKVTDLISFMSLEKPAIEWAEKVLDLATVQRRDRSKELLEKGFDVNSTIQILEKLYEG